MPPLTLRNLKQTSPETPVFKTREESKSLTLQHSSFPGMVNEGDLSAQNEELQDKSVLVISEDNIDLAYIELGFTRSIKDAEMRVLKKSALEREGYARSMKSIRASVSKDAKQEVSPSEQKVRELADVLMSIDITDMAVPDTRALVEKYPYYNNLCFSGIPVFEKMLEEGAAQGWLGDRELELRARLSTIKDISRMYEAQANLLSNRFYLLVGEKGLEGETRDSLLIKLKKETLRKNPNMDKIGYYENMIRMLDSADLTKKGIAKREQKHRRRLEDKKKKEADRESYENSVRSAREHLEQPFVRKTADIGDAVRRAMKRNVFAEKLPDEAVKDHVTKEQQGGIDLVMSWFLTVCNEGSRSYESFVQKLLKYPKRQQLAALYLIEKDKLDSATKMDVFAAQAFYVPNLNEIKLKLVPGRLGRFIRRLRKGSSYDWDRVSSAFEIATKSKEDLAQYDQGFSAAEAAELSASGKQRQQNLIELSMQKSQLLMAHMQSFGITPDMPLDMIEDEDVREKLQEEYRENVAILKEISDLCRSENKDPEEMLVQLFRKKPVEMKDNPYGKGIDTLDDVGTVMDVGSFFADRTNNVMTLMDKVESAKIADGISGIVGGTADFFHTIFMFRKMYEAVNDKTMDEDTQGTAMMSSVGKAIRLAGNAGRQYTFATRAFLNLTEATNNLIYSVSGGLFAVGGLLEAISKGKKVKDANAAQEKLSQAEKKLLDVPAEELTNEDKTLRVFLTHRKDALVREKRTAAIDCVVSTTHAVGGALMINPATVALGGTVKTVADIAKPLFSELPNYISKKRERLRLIDDYLCVDDLVKDVKKEHPGIEDEQLRELVRTEAMAQLGFNGKEAMHRHIAGVMADIIYKNAYKKEDGSFYTAAEYRSDQKKSVIPQGAKTRGAYLEAVRSLGLKISLPESSNTPPLVTPELLMARIMG